MSRAVPSLGGRCGTSVVSAPYLSSARLHYGGSAVEAEGVGRMRRMLDLTHRVDQGSVFLAAGEDHDSRLGADRENLHEFECAVFEGHAVAIAVHLALHIALAKDHVFDRGDAMLVLKFLRHLNAENGFRRHAGGAILGRLEALAAGFIESADLIAGALLGLDRLNGLERIITHCTTPSLEGSPRHTALDVANIPGSNAVFSGDNHVLSRIRTDGRNLIGGQLSVTVGTLSRPFFETPTVSNSVAALGSHISQVICLGPKEKMIGVAASAIIAAMQDAESRRNRIADKVPSEPVNSMGLIPDPRSAVAVICFGTGEIDTAGLVIECGKARQTPNWREHGNFVSGEHALKYSPQSARGHGR